MKVARVTTGLQMPRSVPFGSQLVGTATLHVGPNGEGRVHAVIVRCDRALSTTTRSTVWQALYFDREHCTFAAVEIDIANIEVR